MQNSRNHFNPDSVVVVKTGGATVKIALGIVGIIAVIIIAFLYRAEFGLIMMGAGVVATWRGLVWVNQTRLASANRKRLEAAQIALAEQRVEQERNKAAALAFAGMFHQTNVGVFRLTETGIAYYPATATERNRQAQLPAVCGVRDEAQRPVDFYRVMTDPKAAYAILAAQRVGKSYTAMHLTDALPGINLVIGVKMEKGEWPNCRQYIGFEAAGYALQMLVEEVRSRHRTGIREPRINVILDDWINQAALFGDLAEQFFLHAATDMLSAGIVPYFLLQSDSKSDWGTKHGAQLKNNFTKLFLKPHRVAGEVDPTKTRGEIIFPGEKEGYPVVLPVGKPQLGPPKFHVSIPVNTQPSQRQNPEDAEFVRLVRSNVSRNEAARKAYGRDYAGNIVSRGRRALGEIE